MAYSGTISQTVFDTRRVIENAARRCKMPPQTLTAEHIDVANDQLYLMLSALANQGLQLWCIEKQIYPLYKGDADLVLDIGTVDVLNSNLRTLQPLSGVETVSPGQVEYDLSGPSPIGMVGIKWGGPGTEVAFEASDDAIVWRTVDVETFDAAAGEWSWFDLSSVITAQYFRVRATGGTLDFERIYLGNTPTEIPLARMNRDDYVNLPNKQFLSNRPLQFWFDRQVQRPVMRLWPTPNGAAETSQIVVWRHRHIMDVGTMTQEIEVPQRWYDAIVAQLAAKLALEYAEVDPQMIPILDAKAREALYFAQQEERDDSPINILPNIAMYTR